LVAPRPRRLPPATGRCQIIAQDTRRAVELWMMSVMKAGAASLLVAAWVGQALAADPSVEYGEDAFKKCRACHDVGPNAKNKVGPILNDLFGRKAGTIPGFTYSPANHKAGEAGWVWSEQTLMQYLENPREAMPGNTMAFAGLRDEQDRRDLIAYLKTFSK
jgi:cytochrome c2